MNTGKKAQASMEVMIYLGFFMLVFVFFTFYVLLEFNQDIQRREFMLSRSAAYQVADCAKFVLSAGPGTSSNFTIPKNINGRPYLIRFVSSGWIYIDTNDAGGSEQQFSYPIGFANFEQVGGGYTDTYKGADGKTYNMVEVSPAEGTLFFNYTSGKTGTRIEVGQ